MSQDTEILALYTAHRSALVEYASGITGNRAHAEDLVQEAWVRMDRAARKEPPKEPLRYLYRIVRNLAFDGRRSLARERQVISGEDVAGAAARGASPDPSPEAVALYKAEFERLVAAMDELPERTRIALEMHRIGGCKLREIAAFLDISLPMAHVLVAQGVEHCKRRLGWS
ncbi:sigma-70 family RNA polymerase sigma factor [Marivibrio halodurans]|uniref:Sigma-70 family RNA polymerase sigma factor n=1 Tax=Marivibrio halodurans TaxID=2039722 RepID=A0A8J7S0S5_9PROT|nr:sigma-70 family RNA polymerase sigma factor [Marivibrio halodurans]MBP5856543.1 sigma-70 family RNA polymerase sigma factor [Marivibrio halodurans]